ncbi:MAG: peptidase MA family metallohydrolase [Dehalococcoidia bacterium]|nr:peptidase MA family metallohydrolase [Dehalococcoidia bacterium]
MLKKITLLTVVLALMLSLVPVAGAGYAPPTTDAWRTQSDISSISVVSSEATPQFPNVIVFELQASSATPIVDARLHFSVERDSFVRVVTEEKLSFAHSTSISASYLWDMRYTGSLPTGTIVDYWWTVTNSAGEKLTTAQQKVSFSDARFTWKSLQRDKITLYWYSGTDSFAQGLLDTSIQGLAGLEADTGAVLSRPVSIYIYATTDDMLGGMLFAQEWMGGGAFPNYSTIIIGINIFNLAWGERSLVHELTHIVNHQMTNNPYNYIPVWLDEGLAMYAEGPLDASYQNMLISALASGKLLSVRSMASPFSTDPDTARQEYAQSYSLVDFLISQYGRAKMTQLLDTFRQGSAYDAALQAVYGFDMDGLQQEWLAFAMQKYAPPTTSGVTS